MYRVIAGYVTVETSVDGGRAFVDVRRGELLPEDAPAEQVQALLGLGHIEPVEESTKEQDKPKRGRPRKS